MEYVLGIVVLALVAAFVAVPLLRSSDSGSQAEDPELAELEALKLAKYREIRDAEEDRAQGKLSEADWRRQDAELRAEAIAILKRADELEASRRERGERD
ncbi:hypothetical protein HJD18_05445 [Thermoleophilia bacterium SCSIO 60948]|nr:hypothetical protein HJD18_05445 [Thermoleophilia bacterium SCSIO 60948]